MAIASVQRIIGKYGAFEYICFSSFVRVASAKPRGIARISVKYSIIIFLTGGDY